ncbi:MAG: hypothetical protein ACRD4R_08140 [Candidatus Acidiferrales bacterium]
MTDQSDLRYPSKRRRATLRVFYGFVVAAIAAFTVAARASHSHEVMTVLGILLAGGGLWSFLRFLQAADAHQKLINHEATSFAFVASLLLTLVVGLLQRFGFLSGVSLLVPALMIAFWSIGLILASWRYQ